MKKSEMLKTVASVRSLKNVMSGCYFWTPPASASGRRSYEKKHTIEGFKHMDVEVFAKADCSCNNIYFSSTDMNGLNWLEIQLRYSNLKEFSKKEAKIRFQRYNNPMNFKFERVWANLHKEM